MTQEESEKILASFFEKLEEAIVSKYHYYLGNVLQNMTCEQAKKTVGSLGKNVCRINHSALVGAYSEMKTDIRFLIARQGKLVDKLKLSFGKMTM